MAATKQPNYPIIFTLEFPNNKNKTQQEVLETEKTAASYLLIPPVWLFPWTIIFSID